jgi:NAD-dependent dihydropyrimidine dehydrogenase PreA subunit
MTSDAAVFHFSGSGNSRMVAAALARRLGCPAPAPLCLPSDATVRPGGTGWVGIVLPVHFMQAPPAVLAAIGRMDLSGRPVFLAATSGGESGDALGQAADAVARRGGHARAVLHVPIADSSVALRTPDARLSRNLAALPAILDGFAASLAAGRDVPLGKRSPVWWRLGGGLLRAGMRLAYAYGRKRVDTASCDGCGACVRACPLGNVGLAETLARRRAAIGPDCADCFGCLHACPRQAISFGRLRVTPENRYRPPAPV